MHYHSYCKMNAKCFKGKKWRKRKNCLEMCTKSDDCVQQVQSPGPLSDRKKMKIQANCLKKIQSYKFFSSLGAQRTPGISGELEKIL